MIRAAVLTISDSSHAGARQDASGPAVCEIVDRLGWQVVCTQVLPDERETIAARLRQLACEEKVDVVLTTGGTGVAPRDITPEATRDVIEREIPGLAELMRAEGLKSTRRAALSRAVAGHCGQTLIVNLPGSPRGAVESLNAIVDLAPHVVDLLGGKTEHQEPK